jgi:hypothetical protein
MVCLFGPDVANTNFGAKRALAADMLLSQGMLIKLLHMKRVAQEDQRSQLDMQEAAAHALRGIKGDDSSKGATADLPLQLVNQGGRLVAVPKVLATTSSSNSAGQPTGKSAPSTTTQPTSTSSQATAVTAAVQNQVQPSLIGPVGVGDLRHAASGSTMPMHRQQQPCMGEPLLQPLPSSALVTQLSVTTTQQQSMMPVDGNQGMTGMPHAIESIGSSSLHNQQAQQHHQQQQFLMPPVASVSMPLSGAPMSMPMMLYQQQPHSLQAFQHQAQHQMQPQRLPPCFPSNNCSMVYSSLAACPSALYPMQPQSLQSLLQTLDQEAGGRAPSVAPDAHLMPTQSEHERVTSIALGGAGLAGGASSCCARQLQVQSVAGPHSSTACQEQSTAEMVG